MYARLGCVEYEPRDLLPSEAILTASLALGLTTPTGSWGSKSLSTRGLRCVNWNPDLYLQRSLVTIPGTVPFYRNTGCDARGFQPFALCQKCVRTPLIGALEDLF